MQKSCINKEFFDDNKNLICMLLSDDELKNITSVNATTPVGNAIFTTNFQKLHSYIEKNGNTSSSGTKILPITKTINGQDYHIQFDITEEGITFSSRCYFENTSGAILVSTSFVMCENTNDLNVHNYITGTVSLSVDSADNTITIDRTTYTPEKTYSLPNGEKYITASSASNLFNSHLKLSMTLWDLYLYENLGFGMAKLGFISYVGLDSSNTVFSDVNAEDWYSDAVNCCSITGLMTGYGGTDKFGVADKIQRQDFVVILARMAGVDLSQYDNAENRFTDVPNGEYYTNAILWAVDAGITTGYAHTGGTVFGVGDPITREQLLTFLYRYAKHANGGDAPTVSDNAATTAAAYPDFAAVNDFAKDSVIWALDKGVIKGQGGTHIAPANNSLRCEVAQIIYNISSKNLI